MCGSATGSKIVSRTLGDNDYHLGTVEHRNDNPSEGVDFDFVCSLFECLPELLRGRDFGPIV